MAEKRLTHTITVDLAKETWSSRPVLVQNSDNTFLITVLNDGEPADLSDVRDIVLAAIPSRKKANDSVFSTGVKVGSTSQVKIDLGRAAVATPGIVQAQLKLTGVNGGLISSTSFNFEVQMDAGLNFQPSENELTLIETVLGDGPTVLAEATQTIADMESTQATLTGAVGGAISSLNEDKAAAIEELDSAKTTAVNELAEVREANRFRQLDAVATVADRDTTYPNPEHGDTVRVTSTATMYRYDKDAGWVVSDRYEATAVDALNQQLADTSQLARKVTFDNFNTHDANGYGFDAMNIIGDSISHGANALNIYDNAWTSIVRKGMQLENNSKSHGYVNFLAEMNNTAGKHFDVHEITHNWTPSSDNNVLGLYLLTSNTAGAEITITPKIDLNYFSIAYEQKVNGGSLEVYVNDVLKTTIDTSGTVGIKNMKSTPINVSGEVVYSIRIKKVQSNGTTLHGIWYIDKLDDFMLNNYARSGARLSTINDDVLDKMMDGNIVIMAAGHNDEADTNITIEQFRAKLDTCKTSYDKYKPDRVLVLDFIWQTRRPEYTEALKDFAAYTNGIYVDFWKVESSQTLIDRGFLSDTSHPTPLGHRIIAEKVLKALNASYKTKDVVSKLKRERDVFYLGKDIPFANGWGNMLPNKKYASKVQKINSTVTLSIWATGGTSGTAITVLPEAYRPPFNVSYAVKMSAMDEYRVDVREDGEVRVTVITGSRTHFAFNYSYVANVS